MKDKKSSRRSGSIHRICPSRTAFQIVASEINSSEFMMIGYQRRNSGLKVLVFHM